MAKKVKEYSEEYPNGRWKETGDRRSRPTRRQSQVIGYEVQDTRSCDIEFGSDWEQSSIEIGPKQQTVTGQILDGPCRCRAATRRYGSRLYDRRTRRYYHGVRCTRCHCIWTVWG